VLLNEPAKPVHAFNPLVQIDPENANGKNSRMSISDPHESHVERASANSIQINSKSLLAVSAKPSSWVPELATEDELRQALEKHRLRGDVTLTRKDGSISKATSSIASPARRCKLSFVRVLPKDSGNRQKSPIPTSLRSLLAAATLPPARLGSLVKKTGKRRPQSVWSSLIQTPSSEVLIS